MIENVRTIEELDADDPGVVQGKHSLWFQELGVKIPYQRGGFATCRPLHEGFYDLNATLSDEVSILRALSDVGMAPPIGAWVFVETLISTYDGVRRFDPIGAWGYEMGDATRMPPGAFDLKLMRQDFPIKGSPAAWNDAGKPDNTVNGYLVDARRTAWDRLRWYGNETACVPQRGVDLQVLQHQVVKRCQFPPGERAEPYQEFYLGDRWIRGARSVCLRSEMLGFRPRPEEVVVDLGCQSGGFLQYAWFEQQRIHGVQVPPTNGALAGVDCEEGYIRCARDLARANGQCIDFRCLDLVADTRVVEEWAHDLARASGRERVDHLLLLSMEKHIGEPLLWRLVDEIGARRTYIETNAQQEGRYRLRKDVELRGGRYVGNSADRNTRRLYVIERE